jgi:hypothetical protein
MAKTVNLTVKVDDVQFKAFMANFNALSGQITGLTNQFAHFATTMQNATKATAGIQSSLNHLLTTSRNVRSSIAGITREFGKWGALISGVVMALGAGAGMFGLSRFSRNVMETRRQALGLGTSDIGGMQAALRAGQITSATPGSTLQNIASGLHGDPEMMQKLRIMGLYDTKKTPEEIYGKLLDRLDKLIPQAPKGRELPFLRPRLHGLMSDEEILANLGPEGRTARQQQRDQLKNKPAPIAPDALKAWTDLHQAYELFTSNLKNRIADRLAPVAKYLTELAKGLTDATTEISKWKSWEDVFKGLMGWAEKFYTFVYGKDLVKAWKDYVQKWGEFAADPKWDTIKNLMSSFITLLQEVVTRIKTTVLDQITQLLRRILPEWALKRLGLTSSTPDPNQPDDQDSTQAPTQSQPTAPAQAQPQSQPPASAPPASGPPSSAPSGGGSRVPLTLLQPPEGGSRGLGGLAPPANPMFASLNNTVGQFTGMGPTTAFGTAVNQFAMGGSAYGGSVSQMNIGGASARVTGGTKIAAFDVGGDSRNTNIGMWSSAARGAVPGRDVRGLAINGGTSVSRMSFADNRKAGGRRGPLDIDNWQMNRTASLRIDSVPGNNFSMSGVAMSG